MKNGDEKMTKEKIEKECVNCLWYNHELFECQGTEICHEYILIEGKYKEIVDSEN